MKKTGMIAFAMAAVMGLSVSAFAAEETTGAKADTQTEAQEDGKEAKSEHLVAEEFKDIVTNDEGLYVAGLEYLAAALFADEPEKISIDGPDDKKVDLYIYRPQGYTDETLPVIYYSHGGGYQTGDAQMYTYEFQEMANNNNAAVVSVEYTLTTDPSYRYFIEIEQAYTGLKYVYEHGEELKIDPENIVIMGESAGGGLTARMALYNKDKGDKIPLKGEILIYPMLDCRTAGEDDIYNNEYAGDYIWSKEENVAGWADLKHGEDIPEDEMIYFSPALATPEQLAGLPDTFIIVGSLDLFVNEDLAYASNLTIAGVLAEAYLEPGVPHSYNVVGHDTPQGKRFVALRDNASSEDVQQIMVRIIRN